MEALEEKAKEKQRKEAVDKQKQQQNGFILKYSTEYNHQSDSYFRKRS